jgi:threonine aldolase
MHVEPASARPGSAGLTMMSEETVPDPGFSNENAAGAHPAIWDALRSADDGKCLPYGDDPWTARAEDAIRAMFDAPDARVFFVCTGTGSNMVALDTVSLHGQPIVCVESAHINVNEAGAPERFIGTKLYTTPSADGKLSAEPIHRVMAGGGYPPVEPPRVAYLSQATELGTVYTLPELVSLLGVCREYGLLIHMDGARLANAAASLSTSLASLTSGLGIDVLSFGGTKNGVLFGEAVVVFNPAAQRGAPWSQKQAGQLAPKMRFIAAQYEALLTDELWLRNAQHANHMARKLAEGLATLPGVELVRPVEANMVFVKVPRRALERVQAEYVSFEVDSDQGVLRWTTSWNTTDREVDGLVGAMRAASAD